MNLRINTNVPAMTAMRNLGQTNAALGQTISRLSTGLRISTAADDPAGLIISEGMRSQIKGLEQAIRNSQDAVNMAKTAEGALDEVQTLLRDMQALAVHSANSAVVDSAQLKANQDQIRSALQSIERIATQTQWGTKRLLDGSAGARAAITAPTRVSNMFVNGTVHGSPIVVNTPITVNVTATASFATVTVTPPTTIPNGSFTLNGVTISTTQGMSLTDLVLAVNSNSATTGVNASVAGSNIVFSATQAGENFRVNLLAADDVIDGNPVSANVAGADATADVSFTLELPDGNSTVRTIAFTGGVGPGESGLRLTDREGNSIELTSAGNATGAVEAGRMSTGAMQFQIGAFANQSVAMSLPNVRPENLGAGAVGSQSLAELDVTTPGGAKNAIEIVQRAIQQIASLRGEIGSFQKNFLDSTVRSLGIARENLTATESTIRDADMAQDITQLTRLQILQQTGTSVLSQANQAPQQILQLLQG